MVSIIKNVKHVELNTKTASAVLNIHTLKTIFCNTNVYAVLRIIKKKFNENLKKQFSNTYKLSNHDILREYLDLYV